MTPKEKAKELIDKFIAVGCLFANAKACALICVDEIVDTNPTSPLKGGYIELYSDMIDEAKEYWQQVKTEIENL